jgi:5'(3')-deoxyribonucleotidase
MILTIDVDNVLSDTIGKFCEYVIINKGIKLEKNEVTYHKLPGKNKLTNDEIFYILNLLWENLPLYMINHGIEQYYCLMFKEYIIFKTF